MIIQFGTSRFLQAHVDLFASQASDAGQVVPPILIVQASNDPDRARRLPAFCDPAGFPVILRGLEDGAPLERRIQVRSVRNGLSARRDWAQLRAAFVANATHIVSNSGDGGFRSSPLDRAAWDDGRCPDSFPAILLALLYDRWLAARPGITILPCELVARNGDALRAATAELAVHWALPDPFRHWLDRDCLWINSLVDRIVSEPIDPAGAVAEPYALWAVERQPGLVMPFTHPAVVLTDALEPFERLKLHILNLGHSWLAARWWDAGADPAMTVRQALDDPDTRFALHDLMKDEVVPGFAVHGMEEDARAYVRTTLERFANPFLAHRIADIHKDHSAKIEKRVGHFIRWIDAAGGAHPMPRLRALAGVERPGPTVPPVDG